MEYASYCHETWVFHFDTLSCEVPGSIYFLLSLWASLIEYEGLSTIFFSCKLWLHYVEVEEQQMYLYGWDYCRHSTFLAKHEDQKTFWRFEGWCTFACLDIHSYSHHTYRWLESNFKRWWSIWGQGMIWWIEPIWWCTILSPRRVKVRWVARAMMNVQKHEYLRNSGHWLDQENPDSRKKLSNLRWLTYQRRYWSIQCKVLILGTCVEWSSELLIFFGGPLLPPVLGKVSAISSDKLEGFFCLLDPPHLQILIN